MGSRVGRWAIQAIPIESSSLFVNLQKGGFQSNVHGLNVGDLLTFDYENSKYAKIEHAGACSINPSR